MVNIISWSKANRTCTVDMISGVVDKVKQTLSIVLMYST